MNKPSTLIRYVVVAQDPFHDWRQRAVTVTAHSRDEAKHCARGELARTREDHWQISLVVEERA